MRLSLDRRERLLVQIGDGGGRDVGVPKHLAHVLDLPGGHARQARLYHCLPGDRLEVPVALDEGRGEAHALELGHAQRDLARRTSRASARSAPLGRPRGLRCARGVLRPPGRLPPAPAGRSGYLRRPITV